MTPRHTILRSLFAVLALLAVFVLSACGDDEEPAAGGGGEAPAQQEGQQAQSQQIQRDPANEGKTMTIGSKNFTESIIIAEIYGQALEAAGYTVKRDLNLGLEQIATKAMQDKQIDGYPEYTGTSLSAVLDVPIKEVPKDPDQAAAESKRLYKEKFDFEVFARTPFEDANAVGILPERAAEIGNPKKISDLAAQNGKLTIAASAECFQRTDCGRGLEQVYGLKFKREIPIDVALRHEVVEQGRADLTIPFTTDGRIAQNKMIILEDDKNLFPPYNVTFVIRSDSAQRLGPNAQKIIEQVDDQLTNEVMTELNSRVDLDKEKAEDVAKAYLTESGYLAGGAQ
jgi:glycine betaine/choline ABC-type transport system substrate-binding protein